jgi:TatD DNase family protein
MDITNIRYIDVHCHLDLYKDYKQVIGEVEQNDTLVVAMTNIPSVFIQEEQLLKSDNVLLALGLHPQLIKEYSEQIDLFINLLPKTKFVGEIGLDYQESDIEVRKRQKKIFQRILEESAKYKNKILNIHSRRSAEDVVSMIGSGFPGHVILHWYSGSITTLKQALNNRFYFSINPSMINSKNGQSIIKSLPLDRVLTETDGPFINLNKRIAVPQNVEVVVDYLAKLHGKEKNKVIQIIKTNFLNLLES